MKLPNEITSWNITYRVGDVCTLAFTEVSHLSTSQVVWIISQQQYIPCNVSCRIHMNSGRKTSNTSKFAIITSYISHWAFLIHPNHLTLIIEVLAG